MEERNIKNRCKTLEAVINEATRNVNKRLFDDDFQTNKDNNNDDKNNMEFKYDVINTDKMKEYISYIYEWDGLTSTAKIPPTYKDYESKARNWLNGRRSKKYSNNLFVDMIHSALNV